MSVMTLYFDQISPTISERLAGVLGLQYPLQSDSVSLTRDVCNELNKPDKEGNTHLSLAARYGEVGSVELLIRCGADINHCNKSRQRPVDLAWGNLESGNSRDYYNCMLLLLEAESIFPENFNIESYNYILESNCAPPRLKSFVQKSKDWFDVIKWIKDCDAKKVRNFSNKNDITKNVTTISLVHLVAEMGNEEVFAALFKQLFPLSAGRITLTGEETRLLAEINDKGDTPLIAAVKAGKLGNVDILLRCGADVNAHDREGKRAVDVAWHELRYDIMLLLLENESLYPEGFKLSWLEGINERAEKLKTFVQGRISLHEAIKIGNVQEVQNYITTSRCPSKYYLNRDNTSALYTAVTNEKFDIYSSLKSKGLGFCGEHEESFLGGLDHQERLKLKDSLLKYFPSCESGHVLYLVSKSRSKGPCKNLQDRAMSIFKKLDSIQEVSVVLQVIQYCDYVDIIFDFDRDDVSDADPVHDNRAKGTCDFNGGRIYVGFRTDCRNIIEEQERLGTLAHELTHLAMQIVYHNNCNPYELSDKEREDEFQHIIKDMEEKYNSTERKHYVITSMKEEYEGIQKIHYKATDVVEKYKDANSVDDKLMRVFTYKKIDWASELIARVSQILARYGEVNGCSKLTEQASQLYRYFKKYIVTDCIRMVNESYLIRPRNQMRILQQFLGQESHIRNADIQFECPLDLTGSLYNHGNCVLLVKTKCPYLTFISIHQVLQGREDILFMELNGSKENENIKNVEYVFRSYVCNILVIYCQESFKKDILLSWFKMLCSVLRREKKVIFIMPEGAGSSGIFDNAIKDHQLEHTFMAVVDGDYTLNDLNYKSQKKMLRCKVIFQGKQVRLNDIVEDGSAVSADLLIRLISKETVSIGGELPNLDDIKDYYIERFFSKQVVSPDVLKEQNVQDIFFLTGTFLGLEINSRNIHTASINNTQSEVAQFAELCMNNPKNNIHWLHCENKNLYLVKTHGSLLKIVEYIQGYSNKHSVHSVLSGLTQNPLTIISGAPGVGKSAVLVTMARELKEIDAKLWVNVIKLNEKIIELKKWGNKVKTGEQSDVLTYITNELLLLNTDTEKCLFQSYLKRGKAALLFDGFDEVSANYGDCIVDLLKKLKLADNVIIVTTRSNMKEKLESRLGVLSVRLNEFTPDDQKMFLDMYTKNYFGNIEYEHLEDLIEKWEKKYSSLMNDRKKSFLGVALHARMFAEVLLAIHSKQYDLIFSSYDAKIKEDTIFDESDLYRIFIRKKYDLFVSEKLKCETAVAETFYETLYKTICTNHEKLAVLYLLSEEKCCEIFKEELTDTQKLISDIENNKQTFGLISGLQLRDGKKIPTFVHHTFGEYLFCQIIIRKLKESRSQTFLKYICTDILVCLEYSGVRNFLNCHLRNECCENEVLDEIGQILCTVWKDNNRYLFNEVRTGFHQVAMEGNWEILKFYVSSLRKKQDTLVQIINTVDFKHDTPLMTTVLQENVEIVEMLLQNGACPTGSSISMDLLLKKYPDFFLPSKEYMQLSFDEFLVPESIPLQCAINRNNLAIVNLLLHRISDVSILDNASLFLKLAIQNNSVEILKLLVAKGVDINATDQICRELLCDASIGGNLEIMKFLCEHGANVITADLEGKSSPLYFAALFGNREIVKFLTARGVNVNTSYQEGKSPLHCATICGNIECVQILVAR
ncbi:hypothetical protein PR048_026930 [Dryococelus australis]|uniref:NACHT domain-containing protein n=1 Tax=Dryococelus australis TaxID=614101 RepID=A0ABQ9GMN6_9NEOP|nr:hypothetical protein PR048_026930 [Dryococelus australis]